MAEVELGGITPAQLAWARLALNARRRLIIYPGEDFYADTGPAVLSTTPVEPELVACAWCDAKRKPTPERCYNCAGPLVAALQSDHAKR